MMELDGQMQFVDVAEMEHIPGDRKFTERMAQVDKALELLIHSRVSSDEYDQLGVVKIATRGIEDVLPGL